MKYLIEKTTNKIIFAIDEVNEEYLPPEIKAKDFTVYDSLEETFECPFYDETTKKVVERTEEVIAGDDFEAYRLSKIDEISEMSFQKRKDILPDYKLINAALDIYDTTEKSEVEAITKSFRDEYYRVEALLLAATTYEAIQTVLEGVNFPS